MAGLLNPRSRSDVRDNSFGDYAGGLLSYAGNAVADRARGNIDKMLDDMRTMSSMNSQTTPEEAQAANNAMLDYVGAGTIGGRLAKTLNPKTLELAESMKKAGKNRDEIWKATGEATGQPAYFDPVDDSFRWEIDDSGMKMDAGGLSWGAKEDLRHGNPTTTAAMGDIMKHPELDAAYPGLLSFDDTGRRLTATMKKGDTGGSFSSQDGAVEFGIEAPRAVKNIDGELEFSPYFTESQKSTALHEVGGHGVQDIEGFARGGSPEQFYPELLRRKTEATRIVKQSNDHLKIIADRMRVLERKGSLSTADSEKYAALQDDFKREMLKKTDQRVIDDFQMDGEEEAFSLYERLLGETDSRAVQKRMDYSKQQRIDKPFWDDYDVPEDELTRRYRGGKADSVPKGLLTEFEQAHSTAQKNAALPTSEGGLGLPKDNTAMDRAKAMGFDVDTPYYHGTDADFNEFKNGYGGVYFTESPSYADRYTAKRGEEGRNIIPALLKTDGLFDTRKAAHRKIYKDKFLNKWGNGTPLRDDGLPDWVEADDYQMFFDEESLPFNSAVVGEPPTTLRDGSFRPEQSLLITKEPNIRSPNAAFDPMKRDSSDILSSAGLLGGIAAFVLQGRKLIGGFFGSIFRRRGRD